MSYFSVSLTAKLDFTVLSNSNYVWCVPKGKGGYWERAVIGKGRLLGKDGYWERAVIGKGQLFSDNSETWHGLTILYQVTTKDVLLQ